MYFLEDVKPLVTGSLGRFLAAWIDLIVFALILPGSWSIFGFVGFGLLFFLFIMNLTLGLQRRKARRAAHAKNEPYIFEPKWWISAFDFFFAFCFTGLWILMFLGGVYYSLNRGISRRNYGLNIFAAYSFIGFLTIAHVHWFFGGIEIHIARLQKKGLYSTKDIFVKDPFSDTAANTPPVLRSGNQSELTVAEEGQSTMVRPKQTTR